MEGRQTENARRAEVVITAEEPLEQEKAEVARAALAIGFAMNHRMIPGHAGLGLKSVELRQGFCPRIERGFI